MLVANKIALGQIDVAIAGGVDTTSDAPIALNEDLREVLLEANRAKSAGGRVTRADQDPPDPDRARDPAQRGAAHRPVDGRAPGAHHRASGASRARSRTSWPRAATGNLAAAYERGFNDDLVTPHLGLERDENLRPDTSAEKLAKLKPVFGGEDGTMTAGNSTPLSDGAAVVLLATEEWAAEHDLPVLATFVTGETAAVDYVNGGEGLLMAPVHAMPRMLARAGLGLGDFDLYEIHEAFASQVLCTLKAWEEPLGEIDRWRSRLNVNGGSLAAGHPFAATGGRIVAGLAKALHERGEGRGVISVCAAGGQGVVAILEKQGDQRDRHLHQDRQLLARPPRGAPGRAAAAGRAGAPRAGRAGGRWAGAARRRSRAAASARVRWEQVLAGADAEVATPPRPTRRRAALQGARLRRHRDRRQRVAGRAARLLLPDLPARGALRAGRGAGHAARRVHDPARGDRAARARGPHALAGQGGARRHHRAAGLRRARGRGPPGLDAALPALAPLGLRVRPGGADRRRRRPAGPRSRAPAGREGGAGHRSRPGDRRRDRGGPRARRSRGRGARPGGCRRLNLGHHRPRTRRRRSSTHLRAEHGGRGRGGPQRGHHARQDHRPHDRRGLEPGARHQPLQRGAHQRRAAARATCCASTGGSCACPRSAGSPGTPGRPTTPRRRPA